MSSSERRARVLEIQRMSTEDGPGIRTTVFFKGCTLACRWCHNPESIEPAVQMVWHEWKCMACGTCVNVCFEGARSIDETGVHRDEDLCVECWACVDECPTTAIERLGKSYSVDELVGEVTRDWSYYESSCGGITASGGEPAVQAPFVEEFLRACRNREIHTALDTCGLVATDRLLSLVDQADLVLFDLKEIDPAKHVAFTGHHNELILDNLRAVAERVRKSGNRTQLWIRTPLIPGDTATEENLRGIGALLASELPDVVARWELCAFNDLCQDKYKRLGMAWPYEGRSVLTRSELSELEALARDSGVDPDIVVATGRTRDGEVRLVDRDRRTPTC